MGKHPEPKKPPFQDYVPNPIKGSSNDSDNLTSVICSFGSATEKSTKEAWTSRVQQEKKKESKVRENLPFLYRQRIEGMQVRYMTLDNIVLDKDSEDLSGHFIPYGPTEDYKKVLERTTGTRAMG